MAGRDVPNADTSIAKAAELWRKVRTSAQATVILILEDMLQGHKDNRWYWEVALAVWQITRSNIQFHGPFKAGMHCLDAVEEAEQNDSEMPEEVKKKWQAFDDEFILLYETTWEKAEKALQESGALDSFAVLEEHLSFREDHELPAEMTKISDETNALDQYLLDGIKFSMDKFQEQAEKRT